MTTEVKEQAPPIVRQEKTVAITNSQVLAEVLTVFTHTDGFGSLAEFVSLSDTELVIQSATAGWIIKGTKSSLRPIALLAFRQLISNHTVGINGAVRQAYRNFWFEQRVLTKRMAYDKPPSKDDLILLLLIVFGLTEKQALWHANSTKLRMEDVVEIYLVHVSVVSSCDHQVGHIVTLLRQLI